MLGLNISSWQVRMHREGLVRTFVGPGHKASEDILDTPDHCFEPGTFDPLHRGIGPGLGHQLAHSRWVAAGDEVQEDNSVLGSGLLHRPAVRLPHLQRVLARPQLCAGFPLPSYAASILFEFL